VGAAVRIDEAVDLYLGELARLGRSARTRDDYWRKLVGLCTVAGLQKADVGAVTDDDCRRYLDRWSDASPSTMAHSVSVLAGFFRWLYENDRIDRNPMEKIRRPRRPKPEDLDVKSVGPEDVRRLLLACVTPQELLCVATLAYLGCRRGAAARLRLRDVNIRDETVKLYEKGGKVAVKPMPSEYVQILRWAIEGGVLGSGVDAHVIPMARRQARAGERDDRIIWRTLTRVGARVGIDVYPHSLRAAYAVNFLESHPGELEALQALMGHSKIETTQVYLRRLNRDRAMERVRDLSWGGSRFEDYPVEATSGFEPLYEALQASA
jgi:integrase